MNQNIGIDLGYANTKVVHANGRAMFPSVVGTPEQSAFKMRGEIQSFQLEHDGYKYSVGDTAIEQSRFTSRPESRDWIESPEYQVLLKAALSRVAFGSWSAVVFTGLPLAFFDDAEKLEEIFEGIHHIKAGRQTATVNVSKCIAIPQPMGTLANAAFDNEGKIVDGTIASGNIGVIDIGGKTTNILHAAKMGDVVRETDSLDVGCWDAMRAIRPRIEELCPDANYADHDITKAITTKSIKYRGKRVDLTDVIQEVLTPFARQIVTKASELWPGGGATLDTILLSGGGAVLLESLIIPQINHGDIRVVQDSVYANALGFYKLAVIYSQENAE